MEALDNREYNRVLKTFENHNVTIMNYFDQRLTNASAESFNAKIKALRSQFRGVDDIRFFMYRLAKLYAGVWLFMHRKNPLTHYFLLSFQQADNLQTKTIK